MVAGNHRPAFHGVGEAMRRRSSASFLPKHSATGPSPSVSLPNATASLAGSSRAASHGSGSGSAQSAPRRPQRGGRVFHRRGCRGSMDRGGLYPIPTWRTSCVGMLAEERELGSNSL
jgi:hypothetical protein